MCGAQARLCCSLSEYGHNMPVCGSGTVLCMCVGVTMYVKMCIGQLRRPIVYICVYVMHMCVCWVVFTLASMAASGMGLTYTGYHVTHAVR